MERVSPTAYLSVLICVFVADLVAIPFLNWQRKRLGSKSELFRQPQIWIMIAKYLLDAALVILMVLDISKGFDNGEGRWLTVDLLLRFSITCITISESLLLSELFARLYCGRFGWWCNLGLVAIAFLTLLKLLPPLFKLRPVLSLNKDVFGFWTVFGAGLLENLVFSVVYWWAFCKDRRKWRYRRLTTPILSSAVVLAVSLILGWRLLSIQRLLLMSFLLLITIQSLLHKAFAEYSFVQAQTEGSETVLDEASNESVRPFTSRLWRPLSREDPKELYARSVSDIHAAKEQKTPGEGEMTSWRILEGRDNVVSVGIVPGNSFSPSPPNGWLPQMTDFTLDLISKGEEVTSILIQLELQWPQMVGYVDLSWLKCVAQRGSAPTSTQDLETTGPELEVLREMYKKHQQQEVERKKRLLEEGTISRVKAEWCCRCKVTTKFVEGNCIQRNCEHTRCHLCHDLDTGR